MSMTIESAIGVSVLPEVQSFLNEGPLKSFIGGEWVKTSTGATFRTLDPGSGTELAEVHAGDKSDVDQAVQAAQTAFDKSGWSTLSPHERGVHLHRLADLVEQHAEIMAQLESLDCGKIHAQAQSDIATFVSTLRYYTNMALHIQRRLPLAVAGHEAHSSLGPYGPCGFIFPWNFPFLLVGWGISPALAAGNTVVIKPAEDTPLSTLYFTKLVKEAGIPGGVINVVAGHGETTGAAVASHPGFKRMSFTGSPEVGRMVGKAAGENLCPTKLELGGKGAAVIFDDVDIEDTAQKLAGAITLHTGQVCCTATRWIVQESILNKLADSCAKKLQEVEIGHEMNGGSQMGPVVSKKQQDRVLSYLKRGAEGGAEFMLEGGPAEVKGKDGGFYVKPAMMAGGPDNAACIEEIFGPVTYLMPFKNEDEAIDLVNRSSYGLANSVWSANLDRCQRVAESMVAGNSWINAHNVFPQGVPYAGVNLSGVGGGVNSPETYYDYLRPKSIVRPL